MSVTEYPFGITLGAPCPHGRIGVPCFFCQNPVSRAPQTFTLGGWACPGCGRCYSPTVEQCGACGPKAAIPSEDFTGGIEHDLCVPPSEGGLCGHGEDEDDDGECHGGRHCSC